MLAPQSSAGQTLPAEHCRYGAMDLALSQIAMRPPHMLLLDENNSIYIHESELRQTVVISTCLIAPRRGGGDMARHRKHEQLSLRGRNGLPHSAVNRVFNELPQAPREICTRSGSKAKRTLCAQVLPNCRRQQRPSVEHPDSR